MYVKCNNTYFQYAAVKQLCLVSVSTNTLILYRLRKTKRHAKSLLKKKNKKQQHVNVTDWAQAGAPLISISQTLKLSSNMKSKPKSWKLW